MSQHLTKLRQCRVNGVVFSATNWASCRVGVGRAFARSTGRFQSTVSNSHQTEDPSFHNPAVVPGRSYPPHVEAQPRKYPLGKGAQPEEDSLAAKLSLNPPYLLGRDYQASARLALLHLMNHATTGFLLHPSIRLSSKEDLRVADVGCGTGLWLATLARELPFSARLDGFDISDKQFPSGSCYGDNVSLSTLDIFKPLPKDLIGKYDVVHVRYFMGIVTDPSMQVAVENLSAMLKPGGYLQWDEEDSLSKFPLTASPADPGHRQLGSYIRRYLWPNTGWINNIPFYFQQSGLHVVDYSTRAPLPLYRKPWTEDFLLAYAEVADSIENENERQWFKETHAKAAEDAANGWHLDWELIICVGRKAMMAL